MAMTNSLPEEPFDAEAAGGGDLLPAWLKLVYVVLLAWGAWYLWTFWRGPAGLVP
jgi:hypothetical protein